MRISDWSSDVCSSDLGLVPVANYDPPKPAFTTSVGPLARDVRDAATVLQALAGPDGRDFIAQPNDPADYLAELDSGVQDMRRSEEHTSELQSLMRISYAVFCLKKKHKNRTQ